MEIDEFYEVRLLQNHSITLFVTYKVYLHLQHRENSFDSRHLFYFAHIRHFFINFSLNSLLLQQRQLKEKKLEEIKKEEEKISVQLEPEASKRTIHEVRLMIQPKMEKISFGKVCENFQLIDRFCLVLLLLPSRLSFFHVIQTILHRCLQWLCMSEEEQEEFKKRNAPKIKVSYLSNFVKCCVT